MTESPRSNGSQYLLKLATTGAITPEAFERELGKLASGHQRRARGYKAGVLRIYRGRPWDYQTRPLSTRELSYPPKNITRLGRANLEGAPVFYASAGLPPTFAECHLKAGQQVICSEWTFIADAILQEIGLTSSPDSEVETLYHQLFTAINPETYKFSARIAGHLLSGAPISGLLYPSIAAQSGSHNVALKSGFVDVGLKLVNASLYSIKTVSDSRQYQAEEIDFALPNVDSTLHWKGRKRQWTLRKQGDELKFVANSWGAWDAFDKTGALVSPE